MPDVSKTFLALAEHFQQAKNHRDDERENVSVAEMRHARGKISADADVLIDTLLHRPDAYAALSAMVHEERRSSEPSVRDLFAAGGVGGNVSGRRATLLAALKPPGSHELRRLWVAYRQADRQTIEGRRDVFTSAEHIRVSDGPDRKIFSEYGWQPRGVTSPRGQREIANPEYGAARANLAAFNMGPGAFVLLQDFFDTIVGVHDGVVRTDKVDAKLAALSDAALRAKFDAFLKSRLERLDEKIARGRRQDATADARAWAERDAQERAEIVAFFGVPNSIP